MNDPAILFVKPKALTAIDKKTLQDAGVIVIEVDDPLNVKFTRPHAEIDGSELLKIACRVIEEVSSNATREAFAARICRAISERGTTTGDLHA